MYRHDLRSTPLTLPSPYLVFYSFDQKDEDEIIIVIFIITEEGRFSEWTFK